MSKRLFVNSFAATLATLAGLGTMWASVKVMNMPQTKLFWAVLVLSGMIVAVFIFFLVWGHFQTVEAVAVKCPVCGARAKPKPKIESVKEMAKTAVGVGNLFGDMYVCEKCNWTSTSIRQPTDPQRQA